MARRTARQIAASRRNIVLAQKRSAQLRKGKSFSKKTGHYYGAGKTGRKQAKINKYGSRKHGISIAQQQRRRQRTNRRKAIVSTAVSGVGVAVYAHSVYKNNPDVKRSVDTAARDAKTRARKAKSHANRARGTYKINRMSGESRYNSATFAAFGPKIVKKKRK